MRTVIVYESMFGNTHAIANAIAEGLRPSGDVQVVPVAEASSDAIGAADLVIVGGPTHIRGMTRERSRESARDRVSTPGSALHLDDAAIDPGPGIREWLEALPRRTGRPAAAAFDTRVDVPAILSGRASQGIANGLRTHGFELVVPPESFLVDKQTALVPGEQQRAVEWGAGLARRLAPVG
jgi:hypothetical protein